MQTPQLTRLKLGRHNTLTPVGAEALAQLAALECLDISSAPISDACLGRLEGRLPALRSLTLHECCALTDAGLAALGSLQGLEEVDLSMTWKLGDATLEQLARLPRLRRVDLTGCERFSPDGLSALGRLPALRTLLLPACWQLGDEALGVVARAMPQLTCLGLFEAGEAVTDAGLMQLTALAGSLRQLDVGYSCWSHTSMGLCGLLSQLTGLQMLNVGGCEGGGDEVALTLAAACTQLTQLDISECQRLTAAGVRALGALPLLAELCLGWNLRLPDAALDALPTSLTRLDLSFCAEMGDGALRLLGRLPHLAVLSLRKCGKLGNEVGAAATAAAAARGWRCWWMVPVCAGGLRCGPASGRCSWSTTRPLDWAGCLRSLLPPHPPSTPASHRRAWRCWPPPPPCASWT